MSLVTGIGDEVITVTIAFIIMLVVTLVWLSTRVRERSPINVIQATVTVRTGQHIVPDDETTVERPLDDGGGAVPHAPTDAAGENSWNLPLFVLSVCSCLSVRMSLRTLLHFFVLCVCVFNSTGELRVQWGSK